MVWSNASAFEGVIIRSRLNGAVTLRLTIPLLGIAEVTLPNHDAESVESHSAEPEAD